MKYYQIILVYFLSTNFGFAQDKPIDPEIICSIPILNYEPEFLGGIDKLNLFFKSKLKGNRKVRNKQIPIEFTILKNGHVNDITVQDKAIKISTKEINKILHDMPRWKPAILENRVVEKKIVLIISL